MAKELLFSARIVEAEEAYRIGLLNHLVPRAQLRAKTMELARQIAGNHRGAVMGVSHALFEEVMFDESGITTEDWNSYPIATMSDVPEMKVVLLNNPKVGAYGGGSEAANALAAPAIAAALHDATGKTIRRLPMKPAYVLEVLKT